MAHFKLHPGQTSQAVCHRTVEEIWVVTSGRGEMWRAHNGLEEVAELKQGTSLTIPVDTSFQFRCIGKVAFEAVAITMPPWPGMDEAYAVKGKW